MLQQLVVGFTLMLGWLKLTGASQASWFLILSLPISFLALGIISAIWASSKLDAAYGVGMPEEEEDADVEPEVKDNKDLH